MTLIDVPLILLGLVLLGVTVRMITGPTQADRAVGADLVFFCFIAMIALFGVRLDAPEAFDLILIATLLGFVATIWLTRLIRREEGPR